MGFEFQYISNNHTNITSKDLRTFIRTLNALSDVYFPGLIRYNSNDRWAVNVSTTITLDKPDAELNGIKSFLEKLSDDIMRDCEMYFREDMIHSISFSDDASNMRVTMKDVRMFGDGGPYTIDYCASDVSNINDIDNPIFLYIYILYMDIVGTPVGQFNPGLLK